MPRSLARYLAISLLLTVGGKAAVAQIQEASPAQPSPAQPAANVKQEIVPSAAPEPAPAAKALPSIRKTPVVWREVQTQNSVAKLLGNLKLEGWNGGPLDVYPRHSAAAEDTTPAFQLYGMEPHTYEIMAEFGLQKCFKRTYQRGQRFLYASVYFFSTPEGAYGAYNYMRQGAATIVIRGAGSSEDDTSISFWKGNAFIRLAQTSEEDEESKEALRLIANALETGITPTSLPPLVLNQLPVIDRVRGTEKLVMGPNSGRKFFPAPYVAELSLDRARAAVTADYRFQVPPERLKLLVVDYGNKNLAESVYETYRRNLDAEHDAKEVSEATTPTGIVKLDNGYLLVQLRGTRVFVIMGARKRISPMMLARQIP